VKYQEQDCYVFGVGLLRKTKKKKFGFGRVESEEIIST
jgi:hypothetical protein